MAEFSVVMKQAQRMCAAHESRCERCAFGQSDGCPFHLFRSYMKSFDFNEVEHIVMDWAAKNPEPRYPTWNEWYKATFPNSNYHTSPCPNMFYKICETGNYHGEVECYECKNRQIPADIAEKLHIKPIGGEHDERASF